MHALMVVTVMHFKRRTIRAIETFRSKYRHTFPTLICIHKHTHILGFQLTGRVDGNVMDESLSEVAKTGHHQRIEHYRKEKNMHDNLTP